MSTPTVYCTSDYKIETTIKKRIFCMNVGTTTTTTATTIALTFTGSTIV